MGENLAHAFPYICLYRGAQKVVSKVCNVHGKLGLGVAHNFEAKVSKMSKVSKPYHMLWCVSGCTPHYVVENVAHYFFEKGDFRFSPNSSRITTLQVLLTFGGTPPKTPSFVI